VAAVPRADEGLEPSLDVLATETVGEGEGPQLGGGTHGWSVTVSAETAEVRETRPRA
jgi:hypothetical protein